MKNPTRSSLGDALTATLKRRAGAQALLFDDRWYSFAEVEEQASRGAAGLTARGVCAGDRVAVSLPNSPELVVSVLAVLRAGAVLVPLNPAYTADELYYVVGDAGARFAIVHAEHARLLAEARLPSLLGVSSTLPAGDPPSPVAEVEPESAALIVYTSGTTGKPKGVVLSQRALLTNFATVAEAWRWIEADRLLMVLPCFHLHGLGLGILTSLLVGASVILRSRFYAEQVLTDLERQRATMFFGVPTIYNRLVALPDETLARADLSRMRLWVSGSAPLNPVTYERFQQRFGYALMDRYGMTECCFALSTPYDEPRRPGVVGRALPGVEVRLVDVDRADSGEISDVGDGEAGEILIRGPSLLSGYWQRPHDTAAAMLGGYLRSGDLAVREADGQFRIIGRESVDMIKTRGFKVGAGEIEEVLQRHPAVQEVAVVGVPDVDQGERIVAVITPLPGTEPDLVAILDFARQHLAPHKVPSRIELMAEIPRTGPGKFKKTELIRSLSGY